MKRYFNECKILFSYYGKRERAYLNKLKDNIDEGTHKLSYDEVVERLGTPQDIVIDYYNQESIYDIVKKIRIIKLLRNFMIVFLIIMSFFLLYRAYIFQKTYDEVKGAKDAYFEEVIEVID